MACINLPKWSITLHNLLLNIYVTANFVVLERRCKGRHPLAFPHLLLNADGRSPRVVLTGEGSLRHLQAAPASCVIGCRYRQWKGSILEVFGPLARVVALEAY